MNLEKIVKKNLNELGVKKLTSITESKITRGRLGIISESVNFNSKIQTTKFFNKLFTETNNLVSMGINKTIINEDLIMVLKGLMGNEKANVTSELKKSLLYYLESKLNMDGFEKEVLTQTILEIDEDEFPKIFTDKRFLSRNMADVFTREFGEKYLEGLTDTTKEIVMKQIDTDTFKREIEDKFTTAKQCTIYGKRDNCGPAALDFISWAKSKGIKDLKRINGYFKADIPVSSKKDFTHEMKQEFLSDGRNWDSAKERFEWISNSQYAEQWKYIPHYWVEDSNNKIYDPVGQLQFIDTGYAKDLNSNRYTLTDIEK